MIEKINFDKIGMAASQICAFHCLLMPFLFIIFPYASVALIKGEAFEWGFILFSLSLASFALVQGFLIHKKWIPFMFSSLGFLTFIFMQFRFDHGHETFSGAIIFIFAGLLVFLGHYFNHKFIHAQNCECEHK